MSPYFRQITSFTSKNVSPINLVISFYSAFQPVENAEYFLEYASPWANKSAALPPKCTGENISGLRL